VAHLRHDPSKAGSFLFLQREELPGGLARDFSSFLEGLPPFLIRPPSHRTSIARLGTKAHISRRSPPLLGVLASTGDGNNEDRYFVLISAPPTPSAARLRSSAASHPAAAGTTIRVGRARGHERRHFSDYAARWSGTSLCCPFSSSLYLMGAFWSASQLEQLKEAFKAAGKKLDMGKCCVHFESPDDLPLEAIGKLISAISSEKWIEMYEQSRLMTKAGQAQMAKQGQRVDTKRRR